MSQAPQLRRTDKAMIDERVEDVIRRGACGRLATVAADGWPYVVPLLYIWPALDQTRTPDAVPPSGTRRSSVP
jgi:hypothetical protein